MSGEDHLRAIAPSGGKRTVEKHGREHMRAIGRRGFDAMVEKHWNGDRRRAAERLAELGRMAGDPFPANGAWQYPQREGEPW